MLVALPALFVAILLVGAAGRCGFRQGFVYASATYTLCVVCSTEFLSFFGWLRLDTVLAFWTLMAAAAGIWLWRYGDGDAVRRKLRNATSCALPEKIALAALATVLAVVFTIALVSPPNNWESMAYRMMRVAMWIDQQSVSHYPTANIIQLYYAPLVSWQSMHLQILAHGDRFANMPEWMALVGCGVVASLIARELNTRFSVQAVAAVVAVTLPMGILQGSSTTGNLSVAYWLMCFLLLFVQHLHTPTLTKLAGCGLALGFALLSKPTAYVIGPPVAMVLVLYGFFHGGRRSSERSTAAGSGRQRRQRRGPGSWRMHVSPRMLAVLSMAAASVIALTLNLGHYGRNWLVFDSPLSPSEADNHINERFDVDILATSLLWNAALHWGTPSKEVNAAIVEETRVVLDAVGVTRDEALYEGSGRNLYEAGLPARFNEVDTPNFLHFWALAIATIGLCCLRRRTGPPTVYLAVAMALSAFFFCAVLYWERFNSSYHVPLFMLGAPLVALFSALVSSRAGASSRQRYDWPLWAVSTIFLLACIPWLLFKESAPLLKPPFSTLNAETALSAERERAYFNHIGGRGWPTYADFIDLVHFVTSMDPEVVGLYERNEPSRYTAWFQAYALHRMLRDRSKEVSVEYFGVENRSAQLQRDNRTPSIILLRSYLEDDRNLDTLGGLIAERILVHPANMEVWRPVRPFGGTLRTFDLAELGPEDRRRACDQVSRQEGPSKATFHGGQLIYLAGPSAATVVSAMCGSRTAGGLGETVATGSHRGPTESVVLRATLQRESRVETGDDAYRFEFDVDDYRGPFGAFVFEVPRQVVGVSIVELDGDGRAQWEVELAREDAG